MILTYDYITTESETSDNHSALIHFIRTTAKKDVGMIFMAAVSSSFCANENSDKRITRLFLCDDGNFSDLFDTLRDYLGTNSCIYASASDDKKVLEKMFSECPSSPKFIDVSSVIGREQIAEPFFAADYAFFIGQKHLEKLTGTPHMSKEYEDKVISGAYSLIEYPFAEFYKKLNKLSTEYLIDEACLIKSEVSGNTLIKVCYHVDGNSMESTFPLRFDTLKTYFDDYKNYRYVISEDYAVHKSIAEFMPKKSHKKCTEDTAYIKKEACFVPVDNAAAFILLTKTSGLVIPVFKDYVQSTKGYVEINPQSPDTNLLTLILKCRI